MKKNVRNLLAMLAIIITTASTSLSSESTLCKDQDPVCKDFEILAKAGQFDKIISKVDTTAKYSDGARRYIGQAYLWRASAESNTPEQEEAFCRKALEFGSTQAYMGLYFIYADKDEVKALDFLKQYVATKPHDSVPYVILGESELGKNNYQLADVYLRQSKKVSRASSARVDWMLFETNYLLGNYRYASEMFENALKNGRFDKELKALAADARFQGIEKRPEFRKHVHQITAANTPS